MIIDENVEIEKLKIEIIQQKLKELSKLHIFHNFEPLEILDIIKITQLQQYAKGSTIFKEGDEDKNLYIIVKGNFDVTASSLKSGDALSFFCMGDGLVFGEMAFLDLGKRSATITACTDSEVLIITRDKLNEILTYKPYIAAKFLLNLAEILSRKLRGADRRIQMNE